MPKPLHVGFRNNIFFCLPFQENFTVQLTILLEPSDASFLVKHHFLLIMRAFLFFRHEWTKLWREFFDKLAPKLNLSPFRNRLIFYTWRSSALNIYAVQMGLDEHRIKAISRHSPKSKVLEEYYLAKGSFQSKLNVALMINNKFSVARAHENSESPYAQLYEDCEFFSE